MEQAYRYFTESTTSRLSASEFEYGLMKLGIASNKGDAKIVIARYDADEDGKLGFWEFANILMPIQPVVREDLERR